MLETVSRQQFWDGKEAEAERNLTLHDAIATFLPVIAPVRPLPSDSLPSFSEN